LAKVFPLTIKWWWILVLIIAALILIPTFVILPPPVRGFRYSVKFECSTNHDTVINVHNPHIVDNPIRKKFVILPPEEFAAREEFRNVTRGWFEITIPPDRGFYIDCAEIARKFYPTIVFPPSPAPPSTPYLAIGSAEGFVVIEGPRKLDVVAAYQKTVIVKEEDVANKIVFELKPPKLPPPPGIPPGRYKIVVPQPDKPVRPEDLIRKHMPELPRESVIHVISVTPVVLEGKPFSEIFFEWEMERVPWKDFLRGLGTPLPPWLQAPFLTLSVVLKTDIGKIESVQHEIRTHLQKEVEKVLKEAGVPEKEAEERAKWFAWTVEINILDIDVAEGIGVGVGASKDVEYIQPEEIRYWLIKDWW
jgi:hypothetical protein